MIQFHKWNVAWERISIKIYQERRINFIYIQRMFCTNLYRIHYSVADRFSINSEAIRLNFYWLQISSLVLYVYLSPNVDSHVFFLRTLCKNNICNTKHYHQFAKMNFFEQIHSTTHFFGLFPFLISQSRQRDLILNRELHLRRQWNDFYRYIKFSFVLKRFNAICACLVSNTSSSFNPRKCEKCPNRRKRQKMSKKEKTTEKGKKGRK